MSQDPFGRGGGTLVPLAPVCATINGLRIVVIAIASMSPSFFFIFIFHAACLIGFQRDSGYCEYLAQVSAGFAAASFDLNRILKRYSPLLKQSFSTKNRRVNVRSRKCQWSAWA